MNSNFEIINQFEINFGGDYGYLLNLKHDNFDNLI